MLELHLNYRHPLTLDMTIGESTVRLAEAIRESPAAPSWPASCTAAFDLRDALVNLVPAPLVPAALAHIAADIPVDFALLYDDGQCDACGSVQPVKLSDDATGEHVCADAEACHARLLTRNA